MIDAAEKHKVKLMCGQVTRLYPIYARAAETAKSGRLGDLVAVNLSRSGEFQGVYLTLPGYNEGRSDVAWIRNRNGCGCCEIHNHKTLLSGPGAGSLGERSFLVLTQQGVGVIQMKALISPHSPMNDKMAKIRNDARAFAKIKPFLDQGYTPPQAMIRWGLSKEAIHTCIVGMPRIHLAEEDLEAARPSSA